MSDPIRIVEREALAPGSFQVGRTARRVEQNLERINEELARRGFTRKIEVPKQEMISDQVSNIRAWLYNESRKAKETIVDITTGPVQRGELMSWLSGVGLRGNRNVFSLSVGTHIRATSRIGMWRYIEATKGSTDPITHLGVIVPRSAEGSIRPRGILQRYIGRVFDVPRWLRITREMNKGRKSLSLGFTLGLHHNDPHQLVPFTGARLAGATAAMRAYRRRLLRKIRGEP